MRSVVVGRKAVRMIEFVFFLLVALFLASWVWLVVFVWLELRSVRRILSGLAVGEHWLFTFG